MDLVWFSQSVPRRWFLWTGDGRGNFSLQQAVTLPKDVLPLLDAGSESGYQARGRGEIVCVLLTVFSGAPPHGPPQLIPAGSRRFAMRHDRVPFDSAVLSTSAGRSPPLNVSFRFINSSP
jgi:hypothetical protein